jgi:hypothetical protein
VGKEAIPVLTKGLQSAQSEVRFYAAEALAYLDEPAAEEALVEAARDEPAFRWHAIGALSAMDHVTAYEGLTRLLHVSSAETRYAAFRALRARNPLDPLVSGDGLSDEFTYHEIDSDGPPMIHISRSRVAEIVVFGRGQRLQSPSFLYAGKNILLKARDDGQIKVMRFAVNEEDHQQVCSPDLADVLATVADLGGSYADVVQCVQKARERGYLQARVVVDALPRPGREYRESGDGEASSGSTTTPAPSIPLPEIFQDRLNLTGEDSEIEPATDIDPPEDLEKSGLFDKLRDSIYDSDRT